MKKFTAILYLLLLANSIVKSQATLQLPAPDWDLRTERYYIATVTDDRSNGKPAAGKMVTGGKPSSVNFRESLQSDLLLHVQQAIVPDTLHKVKLRLSVPKFQLVDNITGNKHKIILDLSYKIVRDLEESSQALFELNMRPEYSAVGTMPAGFYEKMVVESIKELFRQFDKWALDNPRQIWFMNHVTVRFAPRTMNYKDAGDTIIWKSSRRLTWEDFKGNAPEPSPFSAQSNCIYTLSTTPEFSNDTLYAIEVLSPSFTKKASWVVKDSKQDSLLEHEQLHFDLCELYGRKFRKELSATSLGILHFDREINELFGKIWNEYRAAQDRYDAETEHGIIRSKQLEWMEQTRLELHQLSEFAVE